MKKKLTLGIFISSLLFTGCNSGGNKSKSAENTDTAKKTEVKKNIVRRAFPIATDFKHITSLGSIDIVYTPGDVCSVEVEGDSATLENIDLEVDSKILTIGLKSESHTDLNSYSQNYGLTAYVSSPTLCFVSLVNNGNFTCTEPWTSTDVQFGAMYSGSFNVTDLKCNSFMYHGVGTDKSSIGKLVCDNAKLILNGDASLNLDIEVGSLIVDAQSKSKLVISGVAKDVDYNIGKTANVDNFKLH